MLNEKSYYMYFMHLFAYVKLERMQNINIGNPSYSKIMNPNK